VWSWRSLQNTGACAELAKQAQWSVGAAEELDQVVYACCMCTGMFAWIRAGSDQNEVADGVGEHGQLLQRQAALRSQGASRHGKGEVRLPQLIQR
jgi:hypothetical protein